MDLKVSHNSEEWKDVIGYEKYYQISNIGRLRSKNMIVHYKNVQYNKKGRIIKSAISKNGYYSASLKGKTYLIHRIVALAFINNVDGYKYVNHKNEIKIDNRVENLEWCTMEYNNRYGTKIDRIRTKQLNNKYTSKKVIQLKNGNIVNTFLSTRDAARVGKFNSSHVSECCNGKRKTCNGFVFKYVEI